MPQFVSPGAEATKAIQALLVQRALQARQAMLDEQARSNTTADNQRADAALQLQRQQEARVAEAQKQTIADAEHQRNFTRATTISENALPGDTVDAATGKLLTDQGYGSQLKNIPGIVAQGAFQGNDANDVPQYDVSRSPDTYTMRGGSKYLATRPQPVHVKTVDAKGRPTERSVTPEELAAGVPLYDDTGNGFTLGPGETRFGSNGSVLARVPGIIAAPKDNPLLPRGVEDYLASMKRRGYSRQQTEAELGGTWDQVRQAHPNVSALHVVDALKKLYPEDDLFSGGGVPSSPVAVPDGPGGVGRAGGPGGAGSATRRRTASAADVATLAARQGMTIAQTQKALEARGVTIR